MQKTGNGRAGVISTYAIICPIEPICTSVRNNAIKFDLQTEGNNLYKLCSDKNNEVGD